MESLKEIIETAVLKFNFDRKEEDKISVDFRMINDVHTISIKKNDKYVLDVSHHDENEVECYFIKFCIEIAVKSTIEKFGI